jgi:hypothetical protein
VRPSGSSGCGTGPRFLKNRHRERRPGAGMTGAPLLEARRLTKRLPLPGGMITWRSPHESRIAAAMLRLATSEMTEKWWAGTGLNRRHQDFQVHHSTLASQQNFLICKRSSLGHRAPECARVSMSEPELGTNQAHLTLPFLAVDRCRAGNAARPDWRANGRNVVRTTDSADRAEKVHPPKCRPVDVAAVRTRYTLPEQNTKLMSISLPLAP